MDGHPDFTRTADDGLLRPAMLELINAADALQRVWTVSDPKTRGEMWQRLEDASTEARRIYNAIPDPHPELCSMVWKDPLDNVWDRCGYAPRHNGGHLGQYMVEQAKKARAE